GVRPHAGGDVLPRLSAKGSAGGTVHMRPQPRTAHSGRAHVNRRSRRMAVAVARSLRQHAARLTAILIIVSLYGLAQLPALAGADRGALAADFAFTRTSLAELDSYASRSVRQVSASLDHISAWISAVGASVALNDLDG